MSNTQDSKSAEGTEAKKGGGFALALCLVAPIIFLLIITILGYGK